MDKRYVSNIVCAALRPWLGLVAALGVFSLAFLVAADDSVRANSLFQSSYTYTISAMAGSAVTMGDAADRLSFVVTNSGDDPARPIDYVKLEFDTALYDVSNATAAPHGWSVDEIKNAGSGHAFVAYMANSFADALLPGESQTFSVVVLGRDSGAFARDSADQTDALEPQQGQNGTVVRSVSGNRTFDLQGNIASWPRRGLAVAVVAVPPSVAVGDLVTVTMVVDNHSTALQASIARTLTAAPAGLLTLISGPIPTALALAPGASDVITQTYQAVAQGTATFRGSAANAFVTSNEAQSQEVVIGDFVALLEVVPSSIVAGQDVILRMRVYNNTAGNLGNVRPALPGFVGAASVVAFTGPSPKVVPSLPPGSTTTFEWTYTLTGPVGSTYASTGTTSANGPRTTNVARSNSGVVSQYMAYVTPRRVGAGSATPLSLVFTVANNGATTIDKFEFALPAGFSDASGSGQTVTGAGVPCTWSYRTNQNDFQPTGACSGLPPGGTAVLNIIFSAFPTPAVDTDYNFQVNFCSGSGACSQASGPGNAWQGAVDVPFTITRYRIEVVAAPSTLPADGFSTSEITATVYEGGSPLPGAYVVFASTGTQGTLSSYNGTTNANGVVTVTFAAPIDFVDSQAIVLATYLTAEGQTAIDLNGINGPNPLYVGGTLNPLAAQPGQTVAFALDVINTGNQPLTLTTSSTFTFTDGTRTFVTNLATPTTIPTDTQRTLTFVASTVDASFAAGAYYPTLYLVGTGAGQTYARPVSDKVSVGLAALVVNLSAIPSEVNVGQVITVTAVVTNVGLNAADNIDVALTVNGPGGYVSGPTPPSAATLSAGGSATFTWTYSGTAPGTVFWTGVAEGTDASTGSPVASSPATSNDVIVVRPAQLAALLSGVPATVNVDQTITVTMQVDNNGDAAASDVTPEALTMGGTEGAVYLSGPAPASVVWLSGGSSASFVWRYTAAGVGTVNWSGVVSGSDVNSGEIATATATSNDVTVQTPATLSCGIAAAPSGVGTGAAVSVTMTVTNAGQATALAVNPSLLIVGGTGGAVLVSGPDGAPSTIPGGASAQFTWVYQATAVGAVNWTGNASGADGNSGAGVSSADCSSGDVTVYSTALLVSSIVATPDTLGQNETVNVTMVVTNTGTNAANGVTPSALMRSYQQLFPDPFTGPTPGSANIPPGGTAVFVWVYQSAGNRTGSNTWTGNAAGTDAVIGDPVASPSSTSNVVTVYQVFPDKTVQKRRVGDLDPGETITYTIIIRNTGNNPAKLEQITDALPLGFVYQGDVNTLPAGCNFASGPSVGDSGTLTWLYDGTCNLASGASATIAFAASVADTPGTYCNQAGVTVQGAFGTVTCSDLACVTVAWPQFLITVRAGSYTIQVRVRLENGQPVILSWKIE